MADNFNYAGLIEDMQGNPNKYYGLYGGNTSKLKKDYSYNFITGGDIDCLSYLKLVLRKVKKLDYCLVTTWTMSSEDIYQFEDFIKSGAVKKFDFYIGETYKGWHKQEYGKLEQVAKMCKGKAIGCANHSKIIAGYSKDFYFALQASANINTNQRIETACLTVSKELFKFYFDYFDGIKSYE